MADSPGRPENDPFASLSGGGQAGPVNDPFARPDDSSASHRPEQTEVSDAGVRPEPTLGNGASNGGGLPFKVRGQTEPVKVKPRASDPFRTEPQPPGDASPPADPFRADAAAPEIKAEAPPAVEPVVNEPEPPGDALPPADPFRPEPEVAEPVGIAGDAAPAAYWSEQDELPNRRYDQQMSEDDYIAARTQRLRGGGRHDDYEYDPYAYAPHRSWYTDARVWGSLLAATAIGVILAVVVIFATQGSDNDGQVAGVSDDVEAGVQIEAPAEGDTVPVGQPYTVMARVAHPDGVDRVELQVDGQVVGTFEPQAAEGGEPPDEATAQIAWTPEDPRDYQIAIFAFAANGERIGEEQRSVTAAFADGSEAFVQASDPVNVREFPSTEDVVQAYGKLQPNEQRKILQKTTTGSGDWYLIEFAPASPTGQGWVFAQVVNVVGDINSVQSVEPPALPTPTPSPTETPSATPSETATPEPETDFDLEPVGYDDGFVEIKNNGPGDFGGSVTIFYLTATLEDGCQLDTASGQYTVDDVSLGAGQVLSLGINSELEPDGLYCVGISAEGETDNTNNAVGPFQGDVPTPTATP